MKTTGIVLTATLVATCLLTSCAKDELTAPSAPSAQGLANPLSAEPAPVLDTKMDMPCLDADVPLLHIRWTLQRLDGRPISLATDAIRPWLTFSDGPDQAINGFGGCNAITGTFEFDCESLHFASLGSTHIYCANTYDLEQHFLAALGEADSFAVWGDRLQLFKGSVEIAALYQHQLPIASAMGQGLGQDHTSTPPTVPFPDN
ncbi:MAG: META domain-containing protein [Flavobacteriales bacterium]